VERYFFHTEDGKHLEDDEGTLLNDLEEANFKVVVRDAGGLTLFVLALSATTLPTPSGLRRFD
jgi:hypothetical protein